MDGSWLRRRYIYTRTYLLNPFRPAIFGLPFMFRMQPELTSGEQLYSLVWSNCKRFIRRSASKAPSRAGSRAASPVYVTSLSPCAIGGKCHQQCCQSLHTIVCLRVLLTVARCGAEAIRATQRAPLVPRVRVCMVRGLLSALLCSHTLPRRAALQATRWSETSRGGTRRRPPVLWSLTPTPTPTRVTRRGRSHVPRVRLAPLSTIRAAQCSAASATQCRVDVSCCAAGHRAGGNNRRRVAPRHLSPEEKVAQEVRWCRPLFFLQALLCAAAGAVGVNTV